MIEYSRLIISWIALLLAAIPIIYILIISLAALFPQRKKRDIDDKTKIAIIIPAHNEKLLIETTVECALKQQYPRDLFEVFVIADNCTDNTAELARKAGAQLIERHEKPGKGQALHHAFSLLLAQQWEAFLVIDADCSLQGKALKAINCEFSQGAKVLQLLDSILNPDVNNRTRSMQMGMASFNGLRPKGRMALGLSCGFFGNGFCLSKTVLQKVPYLAHSIVEDLEYHILLLKNGYKVKLVDDGIAAAQAPLATEDSTTQRTRWEVGKVLMIRQYAGELFKNAFAGRRWAWEAISEVMMPPSSLLVLLCLLPLTFGYFNERIIASSLLLIMVLHYALASYQYGSLKNFIRICAYVPWYILWKTIVVAKSLTQMKSLSWIRTQRHKSHDNDEK